MFYNGWTHDHYVSNVFVFCPDGTIAAASINAPGSEHDSLIAEVTEIYTKMYSVYDSCGARVVVDSAFSSSHYEFLIKSAQDFEVPRNGNDNSAASQATSLRQSAEWGMRALKGAFPRLKDRLE
ncbi:hypothetical protein AC1031_007932 [Aphanomyces cochlioides]|nr:hypothetical protein AC1031_007932 [Aphanomyces cochlioides]